MDKVNLKDLTVYRQIAYNALLSKNLVKDEDEALNIASTYDYRKLEGIVKVQPLIDSAIVRLSHSEGIYGYALVDMVYDGGNITPREETKNIFEECFYNKQEATSRVILQEFGNMDYSNSLYIGLEGWNAVKEKINLLEPLHNLLNIKVDMDQIKEMYEMVSSYNILSEFTDKVSYFNKDFSNNYEITREEVENYLKEKNLDINEYSDSIDYILQNKGEKFLKLKQEVQNVNYEEYFDKICETRDEIKKYSLKNFIKNSQFSDGIELEIDEYDNFYLKKNGIQIEINCSGYYDPLSIGRDMEFDSKWGKKYSNNYTEDSLRIRLKNDVNLKDFCYNDKKIESENLEIIGLETEKKNYEKRIEDNINNGPKFLKKLRFIENIVLKKKNDKIYKEIAKVDKQIENSKEKIELNEQALKIVQNYLDNLNNNADKLNELTTKLNQQTEELDKYISLSNKAYSYSQFEFESFSEMETGMSFEMASSSGLAKRKYLYMADSGIHTGKESKIINFEDLEYVFESNSYDSDRDYDY